MDISLKIYKKYNSNCVSRSQKMLNKHSFAVRLMTTWLITVSECKKCWELRRMQVSVPVQYSNTISALTITQQCKSSWWTYIECSFGCCRRYWTTDNKIWTACLSQHIDFHCVLPAHINTSFSRQLSSLLTDSPLQHQIILCTN